MFDHRTLSPSPLGSRASRRLAVLLACLGSSVLAFPAKGAPPRALDARPAVELEAAAATATAATRALEPPASPPQ